MKRLLPNTGDAQVAARLLAGRYASSIATTYQGDWHKFEMYCDQKRLEPIPVSAGTVCSYLGSLFLRDTVRGGSISRYLAAISGQHRRFGFQSPAPHPMVAETRAAYIAQDSRRKAKAP